eukprot:TRINITY_DN3985_c0_g1_i1.p1 TRINITY_DN3985_c0_g1~~TRINITY_DN3985_c0_g1_i1.p1  ORF type:complete len:411 (+),score=103.59 TRINITY_DN3985_c0_g1_i1:91-1323(+)
MPPSSATRSRSAPSPPSGFTDYSFTSPDLVSLEDTPKDCSSRQTPAHTPPLSWAAERAARGVYAATAEQAARAFMDDLLENCAADQDMGASSEETAFHSRDDVHSRKSSSDSNSSAAGACSYAEQRRALQDWFDEQTMILNRPPPPPSPKQQQQQQPVPAPPQSPQPQPTTHQMVPQVALGPRQVPGMLCGPPHHLPVSVLPRALPVTPPETPVALEDRLVGFVYGHLTSKSRNPYNGSVALSVLHCLVNSQAADLYAAVVRTKYNGSFHSFFKAHHQFRIFHYSHDVVDKWGLTHCRADGARLAFASIPNVVLAKADRQTAVWHANLLERAVGILEGILGSRGPMSMRALVDAFKQADADGRYEDVLHSRNSLRKLIHDNPGRIVVTPSALLKMPHQLTYEERQLLAQP